MKKTGHLPEEVSEPLEEIMGEVRHLSRSRRRQGTLLACLATIALLTAVLRISPDQSPPQPRKDEFLKFTNLDAIKVGIFGDDDLLLPTENNAAAQGLPGEIVATSISGLPTRELFKPFDAVINASRDTLMPPAFVPQLTLSQPSDLLDDSFWKLTETFGQQASKVPPLPPRGAAWRVILAGHIGPQSTPTDSGQIIMRGEWAETPGGAEFKDRRWDVALFSVLVNDVGILGEPLLERGTGIPEIDLAVSLSVARDIPWAAVAPGYYRVSVGP